MSAPVWRWRRDKPRRWVEHYGSCSRRSCLLDACRRCAKAQVRLALAERARLRRDWVAWALWSDSFIFGGRDIINAASPEWCLFMRTGSLPAAARLAIPGRPPRNRATP